MDVDEEIHLPTFPVAVDLLLADGVRLPATVFLSATSPHHDGPETLEEFFEQSRPFLPARASDGRAFLVGVGTILAVFAPADSPLRSRLAGRSPSSINLIKVRLEDGSEIEGTLLSSPPSARSRLSDVFNQPGGFIPLEHSGGIVFLNKSRLATVEL